MEELEQGRKLRKTKETETSDIKEKLEKTGDLKVQGVSK